MHFLDWTVLFFYLLALIIIGFYRSRKTRGSSEEYILAGRRLSLPAFVATLVATWYGGILGVGENTFNYGIQTWFIFGLPYYIFAVLFAVWLAPKIRATQLISIPDHFLTHYGKKPGIISAVFILILASPAPYILSIGILIQFVFGIPFIWALILSTAISLVYIWFGGFGAVVRTDILQFLLMFGGFIVLVGFAWNQAGSPWSIIGQLPSPYRSVTGGHSVQYILVWFFIALWTFIDPGFYQRCAAAQSPQTARRGILISILFWFVFDMLTLVSGLYARVLIPDGNALFAYPILGRLLLPPFVYGLFLTGILATIMSTIDSLGLISAVTFGRDILWQTRKDSDHSLTQDSTHLMQQGLAVMAVIAIVLAYSLPSVVGLWYVIGSLIVPGLLIPFLLTFTNQTLSETQALILLLVPVIIAGMWFVCGNFGQSYPLNIEPFYPGLLSSALLFLLFRFTAHEIRD
ncbi:MAG: sodium:solute symporter family protein [FCB group bacterium]|nr:sodium:solute symporter family protein [FCB group bacterium]